MKENYIGKINKIGKVGVVITNIARVFLIIGACVMIFRTFVRTTIPKGTTRTFQSQATLTLDTANNSGLGATLTNNTWNNKLTFSFNDTEYFDVTTEHYLDKIVMKGTAKPKTTDLGNTKWLLVCAVVYIILLVVIFNHLHSLCEKFKTCNTPFTLEIADIIKKIAVFMVVYVIYDIISGNIVNSLLEGKIDITVSINMIMVLGVMLVFMLSHIFRYGALLQQESDETL